MVVVDLFSAQNSCLKTATTLTSQTILKKLYLSESGSWQRGKFSRVCKLSIVKKTTFRSYFHATRYLGRKSGRGMVSPFVEVEICGADYDNLKQKTKTINDNGFNPVWDETLLFAVKNPPLALLR